MEAQVSKLASSLPVPSVKELVRQPLAKVPERYIHPNHNPPFVSNSTSLPEIPVIDMKTLLCEDETELEKLDHACREWGFFQLINHGMDTSLMENVKIGVEEFFNLPMEHKQKYWQKPGEMDGFGQLFVKSEEQKLEWADMFYMITLPLQARNPRLFPNIPQPFRDNLETYSSEMRNIFITLSGVMTKALAIESNELLELFDDDLGQMLRINYYPPCPEPKNVIGLNPHSDSGVLTTLLQVNEMEGLQIRKDGMWIPVSPLPNAFIINVGDSMEILTNGIYRSVEHRATINSEKERISLVVAHRPGLNRVIGPLPSLVTPERPATFKRIGVADYYKRYFSRKLQGKSCINSMRVQKENGDDKIV